MIARYNNISLVTGIPGLLLQVAGNMMNNYILGLTGTVLLIVGLGYYAKAKGRTAWWCLMGFLSLIGLIVLACLKDRTLPPPVPGQR